MSIPHIKEHLNAHIARLSKTPRQSGDGAPSESPPRLGRIGPGRAAPLTFLIIIAGSLLVGLAPMGQAVLTGEFNRFEGDNCPGFRSFSLTEDGRIGTIAKPKVGSNYVHQFVLTSSGTLEPEFTNEIDSGPTCSSAFVGMAQYLGDNQWLRTASNPCDTQTSPDGGQTWIDTTFDFSASCTGTMHQYYRVFALDVDSWVIVYQRPNDGLYYSLTEDGGASAWFTDELLSTGSGTPVQPTSITQPFIADNGINIQFTATEGSGTGTPVVCTITANAADTCLPDVGIADDGATSNLVIVCLDPAEDNYINCTDFKQYKITTVDGTSFGTWDLAIFRREDVITGPWTFEKRITFGENLIDYSAIIPRLITDETNHRLFMSYVDDDPSPDQRVFAEYDLESLTVEGCTVTTCQDLFESAQIGAPAEFQSAIDPDGNLIAVGIDPTQTAADGLVAFYRVAGLANDASLFNQIPVNNLTQADVDNTGTIIIAREDAGETINTYNANSLGMLGTDSTPGCPIYAGVSSIRTSRDYFVSYGACDGPTIDPGDVDILWVRSESLGTPNFLDGCGTEFCKQNNEQFDSVGGIPFNIPEDIHSLGTIAAIPYSFEESTTGNLNNGYASWTVSTLSGEIGALGVSYNNAGADNGDRDLVDVNPGSDIHAFCSWFNPKNDISYIAGVSNGPTVIAEVSAEVDQDPFGNSDIVDVEAGTIIQNTVPFGDATGIACTGHQSLVDVGNAVYLINITSTPTGVTPLGLIVPGYPVEKAGFTVNEIAISPSGLFAAWRDGTIIRLSHVINHTSITTLPVPTGTWRGIEMDEKGGRVFVYTSDFITIHDVSAKTCQLNCSASNNEFGEPLPGVGGEDGAGDSEEGLLEIIDSPYFWILIIILFLEVIIAALSWATRAGFGGHVYLIAGTVVYIFGMLFDSIDGTREVSPWPLVVLCALSVGAVIANFKR